MKVTEKNVKQIMIAARANVQAEKKGFKKFYYSYVRNIKLVEVRHIKDHIEGFVEEDYTFTYKGENFRVNASILPNKKGEVKYSAGYTYEVFKI